MHLASQLESVGNPPVRGTQSLVHTLSWCWKRPSLAGIEVVWRWACGIPVLLVAGLEIYRIVSSVHLNSQALASMTFLDPTGSTATLAQAAEVLLPPVLRVLRWLGPVATLLWVVGSGLGRTAVLRRVDSTLHARRATLVALSAIRLGGLLASFAIWFAVIRLIARLTVDQPIAAGADPDVVLCCGLVIVATLALFSLWAIASWSLAAAPLLAMRRNLSAWTALRAAWRLGAVRSKLIEINLVMGIIKIALMVLAMVVSSCPLPFEAIATPQFMIRWYIFDAILYFVASDFFHIVQLVAYLDLWNAMGEA